jgi:hypothetical protein
MVDNQGVGTLLPGSFRPWINERSPLEYDEVIEGRFVFEGNRFRGYYVERFRTTDPQLVASGWHYGTVREGGEFVRFDPNNP